MHVELPPLEAPAKLSLGLPDRMNAEGFYDFCVANPTLRMELTAQGEILFMPPAGMESDGRSLRAGSKLSQYAEGDGRGMAFGATAGFTLPSGAVRSPDAAWVSYGRLRAVPYSQRRRFPPLVPEFVIEVMSPSDNLTEAQSKMVEWIGAGVELGWLIDGDARTVFVYRPEREFETVIGASEIAGEGPVSGFVLPLEGIWKGLEL